MAFVFLSLAHLSAQTPLISNWLGAITSVFLLNGKVCLITSQILEHCTIFLLKLPPEVPKEATEAARESVAGGELEAKMRRVRDKKVTVDKTESLPGRGCVLWWLCSQYGSSVPLPTIRDPRLKTVCCSFPHLLNRNKNRS